MFRFMLGWVQTIKRYECYVKPDPSQKIALPGHILPEWNKITPWIFRMVSRDHLFVNGQCMGQEAFTNNTVIRGTPIQMLPERLGRIV